MRQRRKERRQALELLYEWDITGKTIQLILSDKKDAGYRLKLDKFPTRLITGVHQHKNKLDEIIQRYTEEWNIKRMPVIDRNILRMGVYELIYEDDIPIAVTINEYVELAKIYGTDDSRRFINGVLGRISDDLNRIVKEAEIKQ